MFTKFIMRHRNSRISVTTVNPIFARIMSYFFTRGLELRCKTLTKKTFRYYELNLNQTLKYWNLIRGDKLFSNVFISDRRFDVNHQTFLNQYFDIVPVINVRTSAFPYRTVMFRFLESLLRGYHFLPNKHYTNKMFPPVTHFWLSLKYYNCYFFKINNF